jgi:metal-responsive CopG/Arc/MetJ family transcriptional regulator
MAEEKPKRETRRNVTVRLSKQGVEKVDALRGVWSRSEYIRNATATAVNAGVRGPKVAGL